MTEDLDPGAGMLPDRLESLGIDDNTYVIYLSDNGRAVAHDPLRGGKGNLTEGGIRVPLIIRGPGLDLGRHPYPRRTPRRCQRRRRRAG